MRDVCYVQATLKGEKGACYGKVSTVSSRRQLTGSQSSWFKIGVMRSRSRSSAKRRIEMTSVMLLLPTKAAIEQTTDTCRDRRCPP